MNKESDVSVVIRAAVNDYFETVGDADCQDLYKLFMAEAERPLFETVMQHCKGNQSRATKMMGISRGTLRKKLEMYGID